MTERAGFATAFLAYHGWGAADRAPLAGDASERSYQRLTLGRRTAVIMDSPPGQADDPADFVRIAAHLNRLGLSAPRILAQDLARGFILLEDFGNAVLARLLTFEPAREAALYALATDVLIHLQAHPAPAPLPDLSASDWAEAAAFAVTWYQYAITGERTDPGGFIERLAAVLARHADGTRVLILRDYHAENLMWLPRRHGLRRLGLLDFQLGQLGQPAYDLVSLLQDARRDVQPATEALMIRRFAGAAGAAEADFAAAYAALGIQRALRILGIFARLCLHGGKAGYLPLMPRVWRHLQRNLAHPALAGFHSACTVLPPPTPENLQRIKAQCGKHPRV